MNGSRTRSVAIAVAIGIVVVAGAAAGIRAAGGVVRRPEGAAERFLQAASTRDREGIARYGSSSVAKALTDFERKDDRDFFDAIEVGRARKSGASATVPYRFERRDEDGTVVRGSLELSAAGYGSPRDWRVREAVQRASGQRVPSEGGRAPAEAPAAFWIIAVAVGVAITLLAEGVLRLTRPRPRPNLHAV